MSPYSPTFLLIFLFVIAQLIMIINGQNIPRPPPSQTENAAFARGLVSKGTFGTLSTLSFQGFPFASNIPFIEIRGVPYFFPEVTRDSVENYAAMDSRSLFTISAYALMGSCNNGSKVLDPQTPICAKISLDGQLKSVSASSTEGAKAITELFRGQNSKNRDLSKIFKLDIKEIFLVNAFAPARDVSVKLYKKIRV